MLDYLDDFKAVTVPSNATVWDAVGLLISEKVHRVWVQDDELVGVLTTGDLLSRLIL